MPNTRLADISEFQPEINANAYIGGGYRCLIVRSHNGYRLDYCWAARRDYVRSHAFTALGFYQYLVPDRDVSAQAHDFIASIGTLRANEFPILDLEEGAGSQSARAEAWFRIVDPWAGFPATLYAGESFYREHLGGTARWRDRPRWIAAYRSTEPTDAHELWQHTDCARFPGLPGPVDGNIFHGTDARFLAVMRPGAAGPPPSPLGALTDAYSSVCVLKHDGARELFVEAASGHVWHCWEQRGGHWTSWVSLGQP